jgi:hypothetical protein
VDGKRYPLLFYAVLSIDLADQPAAGILVIVAQVSGRTWPYIEPSSLPFLGMSCFL